MYKVILDEKCIAELSSYEDANFVANDVFTFTEDATSLEIWKHDESTKLFALYQRII